MSQVTVYALPEYIRVNGLDGAFIEKDATWEKTATLHINSAKNQAVSFQVIIEPADGKLSALQVEGLDKDTTLYIEWFHRYDGRLIPDCLIPYTEGGPAFKIPMDDAYVPDQRVGALWADIWVPADAATGCFEKALTVTTNGERHTVCVAVDVHDLIVPDQPRITADLNNYADSISPAFESLKHNPNRYTDGSYLNVERSFYRMARDHKCLYHNLPYRHSGDMPLSFAPELTGEGKYIEVASWEKFDEHFGPYLDGSAFKGCHFGDHPLEFMYLPFHLGWPADYAKWGKKGYKTEYRRILQAFVQHFEEKGWDKTVLEILLNHKKDYRFYPYTVDEIWYEHDQDIVDVYYDIIKGIYETSHAKFVFRMDSSNHYGNHFDHRFSDYCGMWVAGFGMFNWFPESVEVMNNKGNILFIYGGVLRALDESLNSLYLWPLQTMMTGATGFTVWQTTGFGGDPLACGANGGSEVLFYPGSHFGMEEPLPTIRLKALRNAMQLTDLIMTYRSSPVMDKLDHCVNQSFGLKGNGDWFVPKPEFVNTPPRYWDFGEDFGRYVLPPLYQGRRFDFMERLTEDIFSVIEDKPVKRREDVVFSFH